MLLNAGTPMGMAPTVIGLLNGIDSERSNGCDALLIDIHASVSL